MSQAGRYLEGGSGPEPVLTLTGNTGGPIYPLAGNIDILGTGAVTVAGDVLDGTLTISVSVSFAESFLTDSGTATPVAGVLTVHGIHGINTSAPGSASTVDIAINNTIALGDLTTITAGNDSLTVTSGNITLSGTGTNAAGNLNLPNTNGTGAQGIITFGGTYFISNYGNFNTFVGADAGNYTLTIIDSEENAALGTRALNALTTGDLNTALGVGSLALNTTGSSNTAGGAGSLGSNSAGSSNCAFGYVSLSVCTTGNYNCGYGESSLGAITTGNYNLALGFDAGNGYTSSESNNVSIANLGVAGESNVIRIGTQGTGPGEQNVCYIAGIEGVNVGSVATVVSIATGTGQLGSTTITAGIGVTVTPGANTITMAASSAVTATYTGITHASSPYTALSTDYYISADVTAGVITVLLPNAPATGRVFVIKDKVGLAATSNITITTVGGTVTIDGSTSFVMNTAYESVEVIFNGSNYEVF